MPALPLKAPYCLRVDFLGRSLTTNAAHKMHYQQAGSERRKWRDGFCQVARLHHVPKMRAISITTWPEYPNRRGLPDIDGTAPSVKGAIDGLVLAGVIEDDCAPFVATLTYLPARVVEGGRPGLVLEVMEVDPDG